MNRTITRGRAGLVSTGLCNLVWAKGIQRLGGNRTSLYSCVTPVVAAVAGMVFLGELLTPLQALGGVAVLGGLGWARSGRVL